MSAEDLAACCRECGVGQNLIALFCLLDAILHLAPYGGYPLAA